MQYKYKKIVFLFLIIVTISIAILFVISKQKEETTEVIVQNSQVVSHVTKEEIYTTEDYIRFIENVNSGNNYEGCEVSLEEDLDFSELLLLAMLGEVYYKYNDEENWLEFLDRERFEKFAKEEVWDDAPLSDSDFKKLIRSMTDDQYDEGMRNIYRGFLSYLKDLAVDNVEVVDYTMSDFGDSYTKYDIIYSVGQDFYAKVSFIDMEKRYEWELVKTATHLNEILK